MTNAEIIMANRVFLMEAGVLEGVPGTNMKWVDEEGERKILFPEEINTFDGWKKQGFIVRKGEHAVAKFQIWMPKKGASKKAAEAEDGEKEAAVPSGYYKKMAFFFKRSQVDPLK